MPNWRRCRFRWALYVWGKFAECWFPTDIFRSSDITTCVVEGMVVVLGGRGNEDLPAKAESIDGPREGDDGLSSEIAQCKSQREPRFGEESDAQS